MRKIDSKIGFIGAGNMGEALVGALINSKIIEPQYIYASDSNEKRLKILSKKYGIHVFKDNFKLFSLCDIVILAVKPQQMGQFISDICQKKDYKKITHKKLVISIAAGVSI